MALQQCPECGNPISDRATVCPKCGISLQPTAAPQSPVRGFTQQVYNAVPQRPALTPEQESYLDKFHWGSFYFNWIWAFCNDLVLYGLIGLIVSIFTSGFAILVLSIVFGVKGNRWAWEKSKIASFDEFAEKQESWDKWGMYLFIGSIVLAVFIVFIAIGVSASYR